MSLPIVVCVGGPRGASKMDFIRYWTRPDNQGSYDHSVCYTTLGGYVMLVDTPAERHLRTKEDYSIEGIFKIATLILNFGDWKITEVDGSYAFPVVPIMTASYDPEETMTRILARHGVNVPLHSFLVRGDSHGSGSVGDCRPAGAQGSEGSGAPRPHDVSDDDGVHPSAGVGGSLHG